MRHLKPLTMTEATNMLARCDHAFLTVEGAHAISKPFGYTPQCYTAKANPNDPKGLTLDNGANEATGIGAHELAQDLCDFLNLPYRHCFGRGSQLRACCEALQQYLDNPTPPRKTKR